MSGQIITIEHVGIDNKVVQIGLAIGAEHPSNLDKIQKTLSQCFERDEFEIMINMVNVKYPPSTFIALLIEATNVARRFGGDIKMINLPVTAKSNLVSFSAKNYLSVSDSEEFAYYDFGEHGYVMPASFVKSDDKPPPEAVAPIPSLEIEADDGQFDFSEAHNMQGDKIKVESHVEKLYEICDFVIDAANKVGFDEREQGKIKVTIYEACLNVIEHAYFSNPDNWIEVTVYYDDKKLIVVIHDWGEGFDFEPSHEEFDVEQAMNDRKTGGFGMHIIERSVDEIKYEASSEIGNRLYLLKYLPDGQES